MSLNLKNKIYTSYGDYKLHRYPRDKTVKSKASLCAWDAADEYILHHLNDKQLLKENSQLLIVNDSFGALAVSLSQYKPLVWVDSYLAMLGSVANAKNNNIDDDNISIINNLEPENNATEKFDVILLKVPKSLAMLEDMLIRLRPFMSTDTQFIAGGMSRHIHRSTLLLFEKIIGPTKTTLALKKSRLILSCFDSALPEIKNPYPSNYELDFPDAENKKLTITNSAGVFSQEKLDVGTRFFIENIPTNNNFESIVDLGCGNGLLGIVSAIKNPEAKIIFTDTSYQAVDCAIGNFQNNLPQSREADFLQTDCLDGVLPDSTSLILCNPPFHYDHALSDSVAWKMFVQSKKVLKNNAELWVIGNHHLGYQTKLKKVFSNCSVVAKNKKFIILKAVKKV